MGAPYRTEPDTLDAIRADLVALLACRADTPCAAASEAPSRATAAHVRRDLGNLLHFPQREPDTAAEARRMHEIREARAASELAFTVLDAFDLGPLALDMVDDAIAELDAMDAPNEDREPWLADVEHFATGIMAAALDAECDTEEDEGTALERHGRGFVRAGKDDAEEDGAAYRRRRARFGSLSFVEIADRLCGATVSKMETARVASGGALEIGGIA